MDIIISLKNFVYANKYLICVLFFSILPFIFIFSTSQFFYTQDGWTHLARAGAFYKALMDGQIPVRWAGDLNYAYGMPLFNFVFHFPYILMSVFIYFGFGLSDSLKIITLLSFVFSGIFMYLFTKNFFADEKKAFLSTVFYQFFIFRFVDMFVRGSVGEMFVFAFFPLILYGICLSMKKNYIKSFIAIAIGTALLILSHLAMGAVFILIAIIFTFLFVLGKIKKIVLSFFMIVGIGMSAYYWMPALIEHKYTYGSLFAKNLYLAHFVPLTNLFSINLLNDPRLRIGDVPVQIGVFHVFVIIAVVALLIKGKISTLNDKKLILFCFTLLILSFIIMQPISKPIWKNIPLFEQFQFPWRFLSVVGFATSMLSVFLLNFGIFKKRAIYFLIVCFVVGSTIFYWYPQLGFKKINENNYWNYPLNTTYFGETDLVWSAGPAKAYPKKKIEIIGNNALVSNLNTKSNLHTFNVSVNDTNLVIDHTQYYPGWIAKIDGKEVEIQFQDPLHRGEITFYVPKGKHEVVVRFLETKIRTAADFISIFSFITFILILIILKKDNKLFDKYT